MCILCNIINVCVINVLMLFVMCVLLLDVY